MGFAMKFTLADQIDAIELAIEETGDNRPIERSLREAALSTLKWVERHQAELRVLGEFPIENIEVLTPQATGLSAIGQGADEGEK
jgi:hypothetical protein